MKIWPVVLGVAGVLLFDGALATLLLLPRPVSPVTQASTERVQVGMTEPDVHAILGGPAGDYRVGSRNRTFHMGIAAPPGQVLKQWHGDDGLALIQFGPDGRVTLAQFVHNPQFDESLLERILDMIGL